MACAISGVVLRSFAEAPAVRIERADENASATVMILNTPSEVSASLHPTS